MTQVEQNQVALESQSQNYDLLSDKQKNFQQYNIQFEGLPIDANKRKIKQSIHRYEAIMLPKTLEIDQYIKEVQLPRFNNYLSQLKMSRLDRTPSRSTFSTLSSFIETSRSEEVRMKEFRKHAEDLRNYQDQQNKQEKILMQTYQKKQAEIAKMRQKQRDKFDELNQRRNDQFKEEQRKNMEMIMKQNQHSLQVNKILANKQKLIEQQNAKKSVINQVAGYVDPLIPAFKNVRRFYTEELTQYNRWLQKIIQSVFALEKEVTFDAQPVDLIKELLGTLLFDYPEFYFVRPHKVKFIYQNQKTKKSVIGLERLMDYKHFTQEQIIDENKQIQCFLEDLDDYISEYQITKQQKNLTDIQKEALTYEFLTLQNFTIDETEHRHQIIDIYDAIKHKKCNQFTLCSILQILFARQNLESFIIQGMYTDLGSEQMTIQDINTKIHFWNAVQIDGKFFYVDPVFDNGKNRFHFKHFNFNDTICTQTRSIQRTINKINICTEVMTKKELFEQIH